MLKIINNFFKNIIFSVLLIYSLNIITSNLGLIIPINYFSLVIVGFLGFPGLIIYILLVIFYM